MRERGLDEFDLIDITSFARDGSTRSVYGYRALAYNTPRGSVIGYMPELNVLCAIADHSEQSGQPLTKQLIVEVRPPGALAWNEHAIDLALAQARRHADGQRVKAIAISDGIMLYARDIIQGGHRDRLFTRLDEPWPAEDLWWLSVDGIYRPREDATGAGLRLLPVGAAGGHRDSR